MVVVLHVIKTLLHMRTVQVTLFMRKFSLSEKRIGLYFLDAQKEQGPYFDVDGMIVSSMRNNRRTAFFRKIYKHFL